MGCPSLIVAQAGTREAAFADYVCDGVDDEVEINSAIQAAAAAGGGQVTVVGSADPYLLGEPIIQESRVALVGLGFPELRAVSGFVTVNNATGIVSAIAKSSWSVSGFVVDGRTNDIDTNGIQAVTDGVSGAGEACSAFEISGNLVRVRKGHSYHIWSLRGVAGRIFNNVVDGGYTDTDTFTGSEQQEGIEIYGGTDVQVYRNRITGIGNAALNFPTNAFNTPDSALDAVKAYDNEVDTCGRMIQVYLTSHDGSNGPVAGVGSMTRCDFRNNVGKNIYVDGIEISILATATFGDPVVFKGNSITGNLVTMAAGQLASSRVFVLNNQLSDIAALDASDNRVADNQFLNGLNTNSGGRANVIHWAGTVFTGNITASPVQASGNAVGWYIARADQCDWIGNTIDGARRHAFDAQSLTSCRVTMNTIRNWNQADVGSSGLSFSTLNIPPSGNEVKNNSFETDTLTGVNTLVAISTDASGFQFDGNRYLGAGYTGATELYVGVNPMNEGAARAVRPPGGRLSLISATSTMITNVAGSGFVYYVPHVDASVPLYDGTEWSMARIATQLTNNAAASSEGKAGPAEVAADSVYDLFIWKEAGTLRLTRGPAWTDDTTRSAGTALTRVGGVWVNEIAITNGPLANRGTYVGTVRSNASATFDWHTGGAAPGGNPAKLHVWNAYNRLPVSCVVMDSSSNFSYATEAWRALNGSTGNRVSMVRGLNEDTVVATHSALRGAVTAHGVTAISVDSTSSPVGVVGYIYQGIFAQVTAQWAGYPGVGSHYVGVIEITKSGGTVTTYTSQSIGGHTASFDNGLMTTAWH